MKININGMEIEGTEIEIIDIIQNKGFSMYGEKSIDEYIEIMSQNLWKFNKLGIQVIGDTIEERAKSFMEELIKYKLIEKI